MRDRRLVVLAVFALIAIGAVAAVLIGRSGGDDEEATAEASSNGCRQVPEPEPKRVELAVPEQTVRPGARLTAVVETSCGSFEIELDSERAPKTVNSFVHLAREEFYDGLVFHRLAQGPSGTFAIQGGDPLGSGIGGPGYSVDEPPPPNLAYTRGVVAMAKSSAEPPGRSGSQFFVVNSVDAGLTPDYALVGKVSEGLDIVDRIAGIPADSRERPKQTVVIDSVTIEAG